MVNALNGNDYRLTADADYGGEPLGITLDVLALDKDRWGAGAEVAVRLSAPESGSDIKLAGHCRAVTSFSTTRSNWTPCTGMSANSSRV